LPEKAWEPLLSEPEIAKPIHRGDSKRVHVRSAQALLGLGASDTEIPRLKGSLKHSGETPGIENVGAPDVSSLSASDFDARASVPGQKQARRDSAPEPSPLEGLPKRPSRLLTKPRLLRRIGDQLVDPELGIKWDVIDWDGPERLSGEWWGDVKAAMAGHRGFARDYFRVLTSGGEQLWLFFANKEIYLHGFFD
ncbi:MAG: hypothetical protein ABL958_14775, partial [Bdellovibrionia bacterium]